MIVAGFGFSTRAGAASLHDALTRACAAAGIDAPHALATAEDKTAALTTLAQTLGVPVQGIAPDRLAVQVTHTQSARVAQARATGSVAEAAALAAAGPRARLLCPRHHAKDRLASCALAEGAPT